MSIWMIASCWDGYLPQIEDIDGSLGYFDSKEAARSKMEKLKAPDLKAYAAYVKSREAENARYQADFDRKMEDYEILTASGLDRPKPTLPYVVSIKSLEHWVTDDGGLTYDTYEIKPGRLDI